MSPKRKPSPLPDAFDFGAALAAGRKAAGLSQGELSSLVGTSKVTLGSWENNKSFPTVPDLIHLAEILKVPVSCFFPESVSSLSEKDMQRISLFHELTPRQAEVVDELLLVLRQKKQAELRMEQEHARVLRETFTFIEDTANPDELRAAAGTGAGYGCFPDRFSFVKNSERSDGAQVIFTVFGRSMEPKFFSGDRVYVRRADSAEDGQIVLAYNGDDGFVIKLKKHGKLVSVNPDYPFRPADPDRVRPFGVVTGKVLDGDFCSPEDEPLLRKLFEDDIRRYLRTEYGWEG